MCETKLGRGQKGCDWNKASLVTSSWQCCGVAGLDNSDDEGLFYVGEGEVTFF